ncbi:hypothetical protein F2Q70_00035325 [Brassica cretica]|uniref:Uncharacterized protein n=1 Tax=Brassica cretica TaxID=69181 RepID=A0A3N6QT58_BRACR|nr:hypothetical protein F2Q70_00035325 [Brassica cretica]KAF3531862.1 hypothetical protein DY000_02038829 [Brassica cretica]
MTPCNPTNFIISQAITSAVDGVLAKYQHEHQELLRGFIGTTARIFIQQQKLRTTQIFEEDDEDYVISNTLFAKTNHSQHQLHELEDSHDQVKDFIGAPIYDDYDDDFCREPCHKSDVMAKEEDMSLIDNNGNMTRETHLDRPIVTSNVESYYVPVTNLTDEPIYDVSDDEVFIDSNNCRDPLFIDEDEVQGSNKGGPFETHEGRSIGSTYTKLLEETGSVLKLDHGHHDCLSKLSLMEKHAMEYKITYLREALALEKEKNRNLEHELNEIHKQIRMLNKRSSTLDKILSTGRTEKSTIGLGYQGDPSSSQTGFVQGRSVEKNKTRSYLDNESYVAMSAPSEWLDAHKCSKTENGLLSFTDASRTNGTRDINLTTGTSLCGTSLGAYIIFFELPCVNLLPTACVTQRSLCVTHEFERKNKIDVTGLLQIVPKMM